MKTFKFLVFAAAATFMAVSAQAQSVRLGTEGAYPPFNNLDSNGQLVGFDIEIGEALCAAANLQCEWVTQDWDGIIPGLIAEKYDAIVASMSITDERKEEVDFTGKYYVSPARFVVPEGMAGDMGSNLKMALDGKTIGVQSSTIMENYVRDNFSDIADIKAYDTQEAANLDLSSGRVDMVFGEMFVMQEFLESDIGQDFAFDGPQISDPNWFGDGIGIAVRKGDDDLRRKLDDAIRTIRENGTYAEINARYFEFDVYGD